LEDSIAVALQMARAISSSQNSAPAMKRQANTSAQQMTGAI
jgi:hypothetical protein